MTDNDDKSGKAPESKLDHEMIRGLAALLEETDLSEIEVEQSGLRVRVARQLNVAAGAFAPIQPQPSASSAATESAEPESDGADLAAHPGALTSPMVGTIYLSPQPGAAPFVREGDTVSEGQTVMIVEAMKTMNSIPAPKGGTVRKILVENEQPVEFGEPLIVIE